MPTVTRDKFPSSLVSWKDADELHCVGNTALLQLPCVSIIGTRSPSEVGIRRAEAVTRLLVQHGYCIVSGLAMGIDAVAHRTALNCNGSTIAVIGTPIQKIYPAATKELRVEIEEKGLVVSQFPAEASVFKSNFPKRNKLMAALGSLTIVIEASETSGTRHQVDAAISIGRYVAIPQSIVDAGYPWAMKSLKSEMVYVIKTLDDIKKFLVPPN